jgi:hypothetical protein
MTKIIPLQRRIEMKRNNPHHYVTKHSRVGKNKNTLAFKPARWIACPACGYAHGVGHFAWASLRCNECGFYSKKCDWIDFDRMTPHEIREFYETRDLTGKPLKKLRDIVFRELATGKYHHTTQI